MCERSVMIKTSWVVQTSPLRESPRPERRGDKRRVSTTGRGFGRAQSLKNADSSRQVHLFVGRDSIPDTAPVEYGNSTYSRSLDVGAKRTGGGLGRAQPLQNNAASLLRNGIIGGTGLSMQLRAGYHECPFDDGG